MTPFHDDELEDPKRHVARYPSRTGDEPRISERKDAVLHVGLDVPGPLDRDTMGRFDRNGFLTLDALLTRDEASHLDSELERMAAERHGDGAPEVILEPDGDAVRSLFTWPRCAGRSMAFRTASTCAGSPTAAAGSRRRWGGRIRAGVRLQRDARIEREHLAPSASWCLPRLQQHREPARRAVLRPRTATRFHRVANLRCHRAALTEARIDARDRTPPC